MEKVKKLSGLTTVSLRQSGSNLPFAYSVGGDEGRIIVSSRLLELLSEDELETVLGHELAHIKNSDTRLKILLTAYRRILFFDPLLRRIEKSVSKENEFAADEFSANLTRRPLSLASALLKISSADLSPNTTSAALSVLDEESQLRPSAVRSRIVRLLAIADSMVHHPSLAPLETREVAAMKEEVYAAV
jgi:Zn-dependent protease with chaperone function